MADSTTSVVKTPLSSSAEAALNRDLSRRKALASAAASTKGGWDKRRIALLKAIETLKAQELKANRSMSTIATSAATAQSLADEAAEALRKSEASLATLEGLQTQLHTRKAAILEDRARLLKEDEAQRKALADSMRERVDAIEAARDCLASGAAELPKEATAGAEELSTDLEPGSADPAADHAADPADPDPYREQVRLRQKLLQLADAFDASEAAFKSSAAESAARRAALQVDVDAANEAVVAMEAHGAARADEGQRLIDSEATVNAAIAEFTSKFKDFNQSSKVGSAPSFSSTPPSYTAPSFRARLPRSNARVARFDARLPRSDARSESTPPDSLESSPLLPRQFSSELFTEKVQALEAAQQTKQQAAVTVKHLKELRAEHTKELKALKELEVQTLREPSPMSPVEPLSSS